MTLRASKPAFNVREKLTELGRRFGLKGSELAAAETAQEAGALLGVGRRNFIMNPKFDIDQRLGGSQANHTTGSQNLMDRWSTYTNLSNHSSNYDIVADAPVDSGIYRSVRITAAAASTYSTNQEYQFRQKFEGYDIKRFGWGTSGAKYSTVSFWVKSSIPGKYGVTAFFFGASGADRRFVGEYYINFANTWEYKTVTIPPLTESINQVNYEANASGMLMWSLGAHSNYEGDSGSWYSSYKMAPTGSVPFFATNGATFYLTGVQWELGKVATQLEHRSYGEELKLCERYFEKIWQNNNTASPHSGGDGYNTISPGVHNGSHGYYTWKFRTQKRIRPSLDYAGKFRVFGGSSITNLTFNEFYSPGVDAARLRVGHSGSAGQAFILEFDGGNSSNGYISASAEL